LSRKTCFVTKKCQNTSQKKDLYPIETLLADRPDGWRIGEIEKALESQGLSFNRLNIPHNTLSLV
jgi:hypothetical protein